MIKPVTVVMAALLLMPAQLMAQTQQLTLQQVLQKVIDHYPSIRLATLQVEKAREDSIKAESQLSWQLNANAGVARETSLIGTATDRVNLGAGLSRRLQSGGDLGFNASMLRDDAEDSFAPTIPNPSTKTRLDINYRHPLQQGSENSQYEESKTAAAAALQLAQGETIALYDRLATEVLDVYLAAATTHVRIQNTDKAIQRSLRLKDYIASEVSLGLSEEKDMLQIDARLATNRADKQSLQVLWQQQMVSLNRLMDQQWQKEFVPLIELQQDVPKAYDELYARAMQQDAALKQLEARLLLADSAIRLSRDKRQDQLDLVMYLGNETNQGDVAVGDFDESQLVGGVSLEFRRGLDKSGLDAELRQAHLDRELVLQDKKLLLQNLQYRVASLQAETESAQAAVQAFASSVRAESAKLREATQRYKDGRIETDRIIDFEAQLSSAELAYELQKIELARRYYQLDLLIGSIWQTVVRPEIPFLTTESTSQQDKN
ncbi:MAG TPA: TolC family protein [Gammaproteobacteria bacterium]